jgi:hypothetical protein
VRTIPNKRRRRDDVSSQWSTTRSSSFGREHPYTQHHSRHRAGLKELGARWWRIGWANECDGLLGECEQVQEYIGSRDGGAWGLWNAGEAKQRGKNLLVDVTTGVKCRSVSGLWLLGGKRAHMPRPTVLAARHLAGLGCGRSLGLTTHSRRGSGNETQLKSECQRGDPSEACTEERHCQECNGYQFSVFQFPVTSYRLLVTGYRLAVVGSKRPSVPLLNRQLATGN